MSEPNGNVGRPSTHRKESVMKGILLWLVGLPIPIIILLYLFNVL